ncbi:MAG: hypothetical protein QXD23_03275 [Candidatus Micrarchaeaceae archaeon]
MYRNLKMQSAMEYLMTYGWSILIIAIALVTLFELGIFNSTSLSGNGACIAQSGYLCTSVSLSTNGVLSAEIGSNYGPFTITGVSCLTNSIPTTSSFNGITPTKVNNGGEIEINFYCPLTSNAIGSAFNGDLWIEYSTPTSTEQIAEVGTVSVKSSINSNTEFYGVLNNYYKTITLTNQQSIGTSTDFQQMIYFDPSSYFSYEMPNLSNI